MTGAARPLFLALYTDEDVPKGLAPLLRDRGFDAASADEWGALGVSDHDQLALATQRKHALLTFNRDDFFVLARQWLADGREHAGIVVSQQMGRRRLGELANQVCRLIDAVSADEMWNTVRHLQSYR